MSCKGGRHGQASPAHRTQCRIARRAPGKQAFAYRGGENKPDEVADFPMLDRRMVKLDNKVTIYRLSDGRGFADV